MKPIFPWLLAPIAVVAGFAAGRLTAPETTGAGPGSAGEGRDLPGEDTPGGGGSAGRSPLTAGATDGGTGSPASTPSDLSGGNARSVAALIREAADLVKGGFMNQSAAIKAFGLIQALDVAQIPDALEEVDALQHPQQKQMLLMAVLGRWAEFDGAAAVEWARENLANQPQAMAAFGSITSNWAAQDPEAVFDWFLEQSSGKDDAGLPPQGRFLLNNVFQALASRDLDGAIERLNSLESNEDRQTAIGGLVSGALFDPRRRSEVLARIENLDRHEDRTAARQTLAQQWASFEPEQAAAWIDEISPSPAPGVDGTVPLEDARRLMELRKSVARGWMQSDPAAAADWAAAAARDVAGEHPELRGEMLQEVVQQWAWRDTRAASEWLGAQGSGPETDPARTTMTQAALREDPEAAFAWASTISDPRMRENQVRNVLQEWQRRDPDAVARFVEGADVPPEWLGQPPGENAPPVPVPR